MTGTLTQRAHGREVTGSDVRLDNGQTAGHPSDMSESPYAIPEEDLLDSARVPVAEQVVEQPERRFFGDGGGGGTFFGDADADGE